MLNMIPSVDIPKPDIDAPTGSDGLSWMQKLSDMITNASPDTMKILVILFLSAFVAYWLRRSAFLKGALVGIIILGICWVAFV